MVSVIIPARAERWLDKTIKEVYDKFITPPNIIVILEGDPITELPEGPHYIFNDKPKGMRTAINQGVEEAVGKYIMKLDAHCMLAEGIDGELALSHKPNWVQIPTRKRLDPHKWEIQDGPDINYMKINKDWKGQPVKRSSGETETFQGSCYFMEKDYFKELGLLDDKSFAGSGHEAQEITLKVWKNGGKIVRNKNTWYAHARTSRKYTTDRTKSRDAIRKLAEEYGYKNS